MSDSERVIRCIALHFLVPSPENARKTPAEGAAFAQLKASIAAHGLLENLLVRPQPPKADGEIRYEVIAGGRRLAALQALADEGAIAPDRPVPCHVVTNQDNAAELSLVENTVRTAMHPADQVEAFARIARDGGTVAEIAARFGVSERTVEHRLRLAGCEMPLFDAPAIEALYQAARGLPRLINRIAHYALSAAAVEQARTVDAEHLARAVEDLRP